MKKFKIILIFFLISLISAQKTTFHSQNEISLWNLTRTITPPITTTTQFGSKVKIFQDIAVISDQTEVYIYRNNGTNFNFEQNVSQPISKFGYSFSVSKNVLVIGTYDLNQVFIYSFNGSYWNLNQILNQTSGFFGSSVSISEDFIAVGAPNSSQVFIYSFNGSYWNLNQILNQSSVNFRYSVSISGNVLTVGAPDSNQVFIYSFNGSYWNLNQIVNKEIIQGANFGYSVSSSEDFIAIGAFGTNQVFIYSFNGSYWNLNQTLNQSSGNFGYSVSISGNSLVIGTDNSNQSFIYSFNGSYWNLNQTLNQSSVFVYQLPLPQVSLINCSSLFSSFECYWNQAYFLDVLEYQINYGFGWKEIQSPVVEQGNVLYQQFNTSLYSNITGNTNYSIQIRVCIESSSFDCGESSSAIALKTKIGSVANFKLTPLSESINISWAFPNVQVVNGIPELDHYVISYQNQSSTTLTTFSVSNSSTFFILNTLECEVDYNISIWACGNSLCEVDEKGEAISSSISGILAKVSNFVCSITEVLDLICSWDAPVNCSGIISSYNFTYRAISRNDSFSSRINSTNKTVKAHFQNETYQIMVSPCDSNNICGEISTATLQTGNLSAPAIYQSISKIEEIEINFQNLTQAENYILSLDNQSHWENFSSIKTNGNGTIVGTKTALSGNVEYQVSLRGCLDQNCEPNYLGFASSTFSIKPKLGNITSLICVGLISGFNCSWDSLKLSEGLKGYSFSYNSSSVCLSNSTTNFSVSGLKEEEYYEISVSASAEENCSQSEYSGINSSIFVKTLSPSPSPSPSPTPIHTEDAKSSKTTKIVIATVVPIVLIIIIIVIVFIVKKRKNSFKGIKIDDQDLEFEKDLEDSHQTKLNPIK
ncbi:hypothetical protein M0811_03848 [Anaeramoeba ignava]|uniref:Fibronectin type-III domain-containing protein n=1 Tax=Anaeramoeba ignava TaxID=1746090 RepID=A0A9Q0LZN4_ANAIG|nr:hypothetical protein M0811_03848 [Anaeramoeba ignava]